MATIDGELRPKYVVPCSKGAMNNADIEDAIRYLGNIAHATFNQIGLGAAEEDDCDRA